MELCLGTVQFGMDYGICGQKKPSVEDSVEILDYAAQNGIDTFDTANAYGTAEDVMGVFLQNKTVARDKISIISKFKPNLLDEVQPEEYYRVMKENLDNTLSRLHTDYLDAYLLHSSRYVFNDAIVETLERIKKEGYAKKVGVSVYETAEAKKCIERSNIDFMQMPYSIFDQRMKSDGVFDMAEGKDTQIHIRSVFIQGLILMTEAQVPDFLVKAKPIVRKIDEVCKEYNISRIALAMSYAKQQTVASHLVFGVDNLEQLKQDITFFEEALPKDLIEEIGKQFAGIEADIVMPSLWKK